MEKQKLVYILNRDSAARLTISSPLEAHKSHTINIHMVGVDVGFENPIFATLEVDYADVDHDPTGKEFEALHKNLTFYEVCSSFLFSFAFSLTCGAVANWTGGWGFSSTSVSTTW